MLSTKSISVNPGGNISKVIEPGQRKCRILEVSLDAPAYDRRAYHIKLHLETEPMGDGFEGFLIDREDESKGRYEGQVGKVRYSQYPFSTGTTKTGIQIDRDTSMMKALLSLCKQLGCEKWFEDQDEKHDCIEDLFEQFNVDAPYKDVYINFVIASKQYWNKEGYKNNDLYLPKTNSGELNFESANVLEENSKLMAFNESKHIIEPKTASPRRQEEEVAPSPVGASDDWEDDDDVF